MKPIPAACLLLGSLGAAALLTGCSADEPAGAAESASEPAPPAVGVALDAEAQQKLGIVVAPVEAAKFQARVDGTGLVVDVQTVVQRMSALETAEAAARRSRAALERARNLFEADAAVSREVLEAAQSQAAADAAQLELARTQAAAAFGYGAPWLDPERRAGLLDALSSGRAIVVRASFPGGLPSSVPDQLMLRRIGASGSGETWTSTDVWLGPADPSVPGPVLFAYVEDAGDLVSGERVVASVADGPPIDGVLVPASAVVIAGGAAWSYALEAPDRFVRTPVDLDRPLGGGYFQPASANLEAGESVVVGGAGLLLSAETGGAEEED